MADFYDEIYICILPVTSLMIYLIKATLSPNLPYLLTGLSLNSLPYNLVTMNPLLIPTACPLAIVLYYIILFYILLYLIIYVNFIYYFQIYIYPS